MNLGIGFPESVSKIRRYRPVGGGWGKQNYVALLLITFGLLLFQVIRLQLVQGPYYRMLSEQNRIKTRIIHAPRGTIYDRNGIPLVYNIPGFREKVPSCNGGDTCIRILSREEVLKRKARGEGFEGLEIDSLRSYVKPKVFAHLLGFISQISKVELEDGRFVGAGYKIGDQIGRGGVEEEYEALLRGVAGEELIETNAKGRQLRILGKIDPTAGKDITLAIDKKLQEAAYDAMAGKTGAVIVSNPKTGEVLTLLSKPSFDPNLFTLGESYKTEEAGTSERVSEVAYKTAAEVLLDEKERPLFHRAISGTYPPGSTFKIITAAASLEKGAIDEKTKIEDTGVIRIGAFTFPNWYFIQYGKLDGALDVVGALRRSNDIFFYKAAEFVGLEALREMSLSFGLSERLGIDLPNEVTGLFPSDSWKRETFGEGWYIGDTYHLGIGQGFLLVTPLQMNAWTNVIANNGTLCQPTVIKNNKCKIKNEKFLQQKTIDLIKEGMRQACDTGGTGWPLFKFQISNFKFQIDNKNFFPPVEGTESGKVHIPVACKTGTAEFGDPKDRTHAWFTAYAPIADPQLVVTVLVEGGGEGSSIAGPIAKKIFEEWFSR